MKTYKKPDLNAPRYRKKVLNLVSNEFIERFCKKYPRYAKIEESTLKRDITNIIKGLGEKMAQHVMHNRDGIELPEALGYVFLRSYKGRLADNKTSGELGVDVAHQNWHSDNLGMKIAYSNYSNRYRFHNRELWMFVPARNFTRGASKAYREDPFKYLRASDIKGISQLFGKYKTLDRMKIKEAFKMDTYDEFDMI